MNSYYQVIGKRKKYLNSDVNLDDQTIAIGSSDGSINIYDIASLPKPLSKQKNTKEPIHSIAFDRSGRWLAAGGADGVLRFYSWASEAEKSVPRLLQRQNAYTTHSLGTGSKNHRYEILSYSIAAMFLYEYVVSLVEYGERWYRVTGGMYSGVGYLYR